MPLGFDCHISAEVKQNTEWPAADIRAIIIAIDEEDIEWAPDWYQERHAADFASLIGMRSGSSVSDDIADVYFSLKPGVLRIVSIGEPDRGVVAHAIQTTLEQHKDDELGASSFGCRCLLPKGREVSCAAWFITKGSRVLDRHLAYEPALRLTFEQRNIP